jgi:hypothetical protein
MARFHNYSLGNVMAIAMQRPDAVRVAGFHTWRELGRYVKKGEKGIQILAPLVARRRVHLVRCSVRLNFQPRGRRAIRPESRSVDAFEIARRSSAKGRSFPVS